MAVRSRKAKKMVRWHALVVAKASGADTDSMNWIGTTTHLQKTVCGTPRHSHLCILSACGVVSHVCSCSQVLFNVYNVANGRTTGVWGGLLYTIKTIRQIGPAGSVW